MSSHNATIASLFTAFSGRSSELGEVLISCARSGTTEQHPYGLTAVVSLSMLQQPRGGLG